MKRVLIVGGALLLGMGAVWAQQDSVKEVQTLMKGNGKNAGAMSAMVKGEKPYDQATVDSALAQFEDTAKKLPNLFPASAKGVKLDGDYSTSPKVWEDKAGFDAKIASFAKVVSEAKAKIKDLDSLKASMPRDRQGMRRLPRNVPHQEQLRRMLSIIRTWERQGRLRKQPPFSVYKVFPFTRSDGSPSERLCSQQRPRR